MYPSLHDGRLFWLESRAQEAGRIVLVCRDPDGGVLTVTPPGFSIRSRVHEYGGRCFVIDRGRVYFCNDADQRLYAQALDGGAPRALTPEVLSDGRHARYADLTIRGDGALLIFVMERASGDDLPENLIACIRLDNTTALQEPQSLAAGHDFYAAPVLSPSGRRLAWLEWDHPCMPWDESSLCQAALRDTGGAIVTAPAQRIAGGSGRSVNQPLYISDDELLFAMDQDDRSGTAADYWNLYCWKNGAVLPVTRDQAEFGAAHWVFGGHRVATIGDRLIIAVRSGEEGDSLVLVDPGSGEQREVAQQFNAITDLATAPGGASAVFVAANAMDEPCIARYDDRAANCEVVKRGEGLVRERDVSVARPVRFPTRDGSTSHAYFYPPRNSAFAPPAGTQPPLLVIVHGGPTARATPAFDPARQYWTTRGYAVLDVNHRGSTGFGRRYRQALYGHWGEMDANDTVDAVAHVVERGLVDPGRVVIRGRSAGGYVVLRALTEYPDVFAGAACYFGIGNLVTLAETTHKFELKYIDRLIGEIFDADRARSTESLYYRRSPVNFLDQLRSPMIIFQGSADRVVPPALARELVAALENRGVVHEYIEYPGEGHGFRSSAANCDALARETRFYNKTLDLES